MDPITLAIISAIVSSVVAAAIWITLEEFVCEVIETILPKRYGKKISNFVRKVIGIVRHIGDLAELACNVIEFSGVERILDKETVEWSEVPSDIKSEISKKGQYCYEHAV